jgi:hypothetical protein
MIGLKKISIMESTILSSPFLRQQLKATDWKNRAELHQQVLLYRLMKKKRLSAIEGQLYFHLRNRYQESYVQLLKEMNPVAYKAYLEQQEALLCRQSMEQQSLADRQREWIAQEKREYAMWLSLQS